MFAGLEDPEVALARAFRWQKMIESGAVKSNSDLARMRIANYYLDRKEFDEAKDHYSRLLQEYPDSPFAPKARLLHALAGQRKVRGARYNAGELQDVEGELLHAKAIDKGKESESEIDLALETLRDKRLQRDYETAKFYLRQGHATAAALCLKGLSDRAPDSRYAGYARAALAELAKPVEATE